MPPLDPQITLDLLAEEMPAVEHQAQELGLVFHSGMGELATDLYFPFTAPDGQQYLLRLRCDQYDAKPPSFQFVNPSNIEETGAQWWPNMAGVGYPRGDRGEVVYCTAGIREYHVHPSHRGESYPKSIWKLRRVVSLVWKYLSEPYTGRGVQ